MLGLTNILQCEVELRVCAKKVVPKNIESLGELNLVASPVAIKFLNLSEQPLVVSVSSQIGMVLSVKMTFNLHYVLSPEQRIYAGTEMLEQWITMVSMRFHTMKII